MKQVLVISAFIALVAALAYGSFQLDRWFKYKFGYQAKVQTEMQPLADRVTALEKRVAELERNSK